MIPLLLILPLLLPQEHDLKGSIATLVSRLAADDITEREEAREGLFKLGDPAVPFLEAKLKEAEASVKAEIQAVLARIRNARFRESFHRLGLRFDNYPAASLEPTLHPKGKVRWRFDYEEQEHSRRGWTPLVAKGKILFCGNGEVASVDPATGEVAWRRIVSRSGVSGIAVGADSVFVPGHEVDMSPLCLSLADGAIKWRTKSSLASQSTPLVLGDYVLSATNGAVKVGDDTYEETGYLTLLTCKDGRTIWTHKAPAGFVSRPVLFRDSFLAITQRGVVESLDIATGEPTWSTQAEGTPGAWGLVLSGTSLLVGTHIGAGTELACLNAVNGKTIWKSQAAGYYTTPVVREGEVYTVNASRLTALSLKDGSEKWTFDLGADSMCDPLVTDKLIYLAAGRDVMAIDRSTRKVAWRLEVGHGAAQGCPLLLHQGVLYGSFTGPIKEGAEYPPIQRVAIE